MTCMVMITIVTTTGVEVEVERSIGRVMAMKRLLVGSFSRVIVKIERLLVVRVRKGLIT